MADGAAVLAPVVAGEENLAEAGTMTEEDPATKMSPMKRTITRGKETLGTGTKASASVTRTTTILPAAEARRLKFPATKAAGRTLTMSETVGQSRRRNQPQQPLLFRSQLQFQKQRSRLSREKWSISEPP